MVRNFRLLASDEVGFIISAELGLLLTIAVFGMSVGLTEVRNSVTGELNDISQAFGAVSQSYYVPGLAKASACRHECYNVSGLTETSAWQHECRQDCGAQCYNAFELT